MFRYGTAEVVIPGDRIDLQALIGGSFAQILAASFWQIERIPVRTLAIDFHAVISELRSAVDHLLRGQSIATIPNAPVCDAIEADLNVGRGRRCVGQIRCHPSQRRGLYKGAPT